jgi:nucleotide-binding universal stress UspA family protein
MARRLQLLVDSAVDSDATARHAVIMADHLDAELVATEIRNTRWFDSARKTEAARHLFQDRLATISDLAADHGVEIRDVRQKAVGDRPKDILRLAHEIDPNVLISGARGGATTGLGLSDRASGLFNLSKYNLLLVKDLDHDTGEYKKILVSAESPINISDCAARIADGYDAELTAVQVVDLEEGLVRERVVYLPEAAAPSAAGRERRRLGETVKTSDTLLAKMKANRLTRGQALADAVADVARDRGIPASTQVLVGKPSDEIARLTRREHFDLLVMGSKDESVLKKLMHKTAPEAIARKVHSSVFAVRRVT